MLRMENDEWDEIITTNLSSIFRLSKIFSAPSSVVAVPTTTAPCLPNLSAIA